MVDTELIKQEESIKLIKSARGIMHWEIKMLSLDVDKLKDVNDKLVGLYGNERVINNDEL